MADEETPLSASVPSHGRAWTIAIAAFLIHSVEEVVLDLPGWAASHPLLPWLSWMAPSGVFVAAVGVLALAVGVMGLYAMATAPRWSRWALIVFAVVMLVNAASHVALSLLASSLMPGAATAAVLVAPVFGVILWLMLNRR